MTTKEIVTRLKERENLNRQLLAISQGSSDYVDAANCEIDFLETLIAEIEKGEK